MESMDTNIKDIIRGIKIDIVNNRYKCISAYKIPKDVEHWLNCPICDLKPLIWEFNNGSSTGCGCGENQHRNFSIVTESIMSHISRNNGFALNYDHHKLKNNWNHWVCTREELETHKGLLEEGKW
jgi:hypothetical protein